MSYSPPNYTDGVPIKISERFKQPPPIHLPTKIIQHLAKTEVPVAFEDYNFDLEHKIISKTSEWINWRARERSERQERIQQRDLARLKRLEDEQKQKLNEVSYPSTDEISSCDEDEELTNEAKNSQQQIIPPEKPFSPTNFNTILMPTQALQDPIAVKKAHRRYASNSSNKIDFSFFESDTSPFDHLEMKSMNEMEVLAQVLGSSTQNEATNVNKIERNSSSESESSEHHKNNNNATIATPIDVPQQPQVVPNNQQHQHQQQQQFQQHFVPQLYNNSTFYGGATGNNYYNYGTAASATPPQTTTFNLVNHQNQFLYPQNYAVNYNYNHYQALTNNNNNSVVNGTHENVDEVVVVKSKNVPSIFQELNDELNNSERRRIRNNSQNSQKEVTQECKCHTTC